MKKTIYLVIIPILITANTLLFTESTNINFKASYTISNNKKTYPKVIYKNFKSEDELIKTEIKIPIITGLNNEEMEKKLNHIIEKDIISFKNEIEEISKEYSDEADKLGIPKVRHVAYSDYTITTNKNDLLSFYVTFYHNTGGAHGLSIRRSYNINTKTCQLLTLKDFFNEVPNYKSIIDNKILTQIDENKGIYFPNAFKGILENQGFYLKNNYLVVFFQHYDIAPYAAGMPEFKIHLDKFKG